MDIEKGVKEYLEKIGSVDRKDIIEHDFREGINWALAQLRANPLEALVIKKNGGRDPMLILNVFLYSNFTWYETVISKKKSNELKEPIHIALKNLQDKLNEGIPDADIIIKADWFADS